jgi:CheY-like chemotaxis protein
MEQKKILLADDDADDREILERVLGRKDDIMLLPSAQNGREVIDFLDRIPSYSQLPDLIILDHNMPKMNGTETLEILKGNPRYESISIVIYSTHSDLRLTQKCIALGAAMVLTKPSTMLEYEATISQFLEVVAD